MEIGDGAFSDTNLEGTLVIPPTVATIGNSAFDNTKLTRLNLSKATSTSLVEMGDAASSEATRRDISATFSQ